MEKEEINILDITKEDCTKHKIQYFLKENIVILYILYYDNNILLYIYSINNFI